MNEWMRAFGSFNGALDYNASPKLNGFNFYDKKNKSNSNRMSGTFTNDNFFNNVNRKVLREWETSNDICDIYKLINKNRKLIKESLKEYLIDQNGAQLVQADNLIGIIKNILPKMKLSHTQWKMLVLVGKSGVENLVDLGLFFQMIE